MILWKRTGNNEYPEQGEVCLIYFFYTGFSFSTYTFDKDPILGDCHSFYDEGGFLGDEDLLWIPFEEAKQLSEINKSLIPENYLKDKKFMKWDNPEKVEKVVELIEDFTISFDNKDYHLYKGEQFGRTNFCREESICIRKEDSSMNQYSIPNKLLKEIDINFEDIKNVDKR